MWNRRKRRIENKNGKGTAGIVIDNVTIPAVFYLSGKQNLISVAIVKKFILCATKCISGCSYVYTL